VKPANDRRRQARGELAKQLRPVRAAVLMAGLARAYLGAAWTESESAQAANLVLVYGVDALEGYFCKAGRN